GVGRLPVLLEFPGIHRFAAEVETMPEPAAWSRPQPPDVLSLATATRNILDPHVVWRNENIHGQSPVREGDRLETKIARIQQPGPARMPHDQPATHGGLDP